MILILKMKRYSGERGVTNESWRSGQMLDGSQ